jgi:flagellar basal body-associated protein FliL
MKSCLGILIVFLTFVAVVGGGALIWYLSSTAEFSRKEASTAPPKATPVPPRAVPVR